MTRRVHERAGELQAEPASTRRLAALGTLAVPLAQELAGLLGTIASHAEGALTKRSVPSDDTDLALVLAATSRARSIVEQMQRLARRQVKEPVPVDLGMVASEGLGLLRLTIPAAISVQVAIAPELEPVLMDQMSAHQLLVSLVTGSASLLGPGDALHVTVERCTVDETLAASHAGLTPGRYVKLEAHARALSSSASTETRRWGFELAVVEGIVAEHGGTVVTQAARDGSRTVTCLFPALEGVAPEARS